MGTVRCPPSSISVSLSRKQLAGRTSEESPSKGPLQVAKYIYQDQP
jgi:hypothetical protein